MRLSSRLVMVDWPQNASRMTQAAEALRAAIVERRLQHPVDPDLDAHVAAAVAEETPRGFRLVKHRRSAQIDAAVALSMCVVRAVHAPQRGPALLGWI